MLNALQLAISAIIYSRVNCRLELVEKVVFHLVEVFIQDNEPFILVISLMRGVDQIISLSVGNGLVQGVGDSLFNIERSGGAQGLNNGWNF